MKISHHIDDATLIKYVDRLLMFYVKTADRLQRTSVWRDKKHGTLLPIPKKVRGSKGDGDVVLVALRSRA